MHTLQITTLIRQTKTKSDEIDVAKQTTRKAIQAIIIKLRLSTRNVGIYHKTNPIQKYRVPVHIFHLKVKQKVKSCSLRMLLKGLI